MRGSGVGSVLRRLPNPGYRSTYPSSSTGESAAGPNPHARQLLRKLWVKPSEWLTILWRVWRTRFALYRFPPPDTRGSISEHLSATLELPSATTNA